MKSPIKHKLRVIINNNKHYEFRLDTGSTYLDHKNSIKKENYCARHHYENPTEKKLIDNLVPSPSSYKY
jgi:hypothetical protein